MTCPICPTPEKVQYASERAAKKAMRAILEAKRDGGGWLHVYRCGGHHHVGHGVKSLKPRRKTA